MVGEFVFVKCLGEHLAHTKRLDGCCRLMLGGGVDGDAAVIVLVFSS